MLKKTVQVLLMSGIAMNAVYAMDNDQNEKKSPIVTPIVKNNPEAIETSDEKSQPNQLLFSDDLKLQNKCLSYLPAVLLKLAPEDRANIKSPNELLALCYVAYMGDSFGKLITGVLDNFLDDSSED